IVAADAFLVKDFARSGFQTAYDAGVAPEPNVIVHEDARGNIGSRFFDLVSQFRFAACRGFAWFDGGDHVAAAAASAGAKNEIAGDHGRTDAAPVEGFVI